MARESTRCSTLLRGAPTVLLPTDKLEPKVFWQLVEKHHVTNVFTVPTIVKMLVEDPAVDRFDHSSLRYVIYAGAPMYRADQKRALEKLGKVLVQYFGLGEVTGCITVLPRAMHAIDDDDPDANVGSCGRPRTGMEVAILDENLQQVPVGTVGEICCRGLGGVRRLFQQPGGNCEGAPRWMVSHRRSRAHGRARAALHHRPRVRHVHLGWARTCIRAKSKRSC